MIYITKGTVNTNIVLTLNEKVTIPNPTFLFSFTDDQNKTVKNFICADTTLGANDRCNKFDIEENVNEDLLNGVVSLNRIGFWYYKVYAQTSTTNLDPSLADELVEEGKVQVEGTSGITKVRRTLTINRNSHNP